MKASASGNSIQFTIPLEVSVAVGDIQTQDLHQLFLVQVLRSIQANSEESILSWFRSNRNPPQPAGNFFDRFSMESLASEGFNWNAALAAGLGSFVAYKNEARHQGCSCKNRLLGSTSTKL